MRPLKSIPEGKTDHERNHLYSQYQLLLIRNAVDISSIDPKCAFGFDSLCSLYRSSPESVTKTFCLETGPRAVLTAAALLGSADKSSDVSSAVSRDWYASFIVQEDRAAYLTTLNKLPLAEPDFLRAARARHSDCLWLFFGRNAGAAAMTGRPEHTDQITHSGTWHVQLAGTKAWNLRPNPDAHWPAGAAPTLAPAAGQRLRVEARAGDLLVINTGAWFHATEIPPGPGPGPAFTLSYARDFRLPAAAVAGGDVDAECDMTNVEGTWAADRIEEGTQVLARRARGGRWRGRE
jgi:hypothetical protein